VDEKNRECGRTSPIRLWNLSSLCVVLQVGDDVLEHLRPRPFLHPGELGRRVTGPFPVDDLGEEPLPKHRSLVENTLLP
jgi:hypothetical protein